MAEKRTSTATVVRLNGAPSVGKTIPMTDLMEKLAYEMDVLKGLLASVETGVCDVIDDAKIGLDGGIAVSLQQLDLAIQTSEVLGAILRSIASDGPQDDHCLDDALDGVTLHDLAARVRG